MGSWTHVVLACHRVVLRRRSRVVRALGAVTLAAGTLTLPLAASPSAQAAPAGLSGSDWTAASLPAGNYVGDGQNGYAISPVSCVAGTQFCLAVVSNPSVTGPNGVIGESDVVSSDGGMTWTAYTDLPSADMYANAVSCVSTSVCWIAGPGPRDQPEVAETTDGGQTWTLQTPADWADADYSGWPNAIDCPTATTCWIAGEGAGSSQDPWVAETTDGTDWTTFTNLPAITPYDPNGTYALNAISCVSALDCVAGGGLDEGDGLAQIIYTTDGGATWTLSTDPTLAGLQQIFGLSCLPVSNGLPACTAAAGSLSAAGPVVVSSADGGATWSGMETYDNTGWMSSVSCPDTAHCWAAGAGTSVALVGTADGGSSWSSVTSDTTDEYGNVSCASVSLCIATTDNALYVTSDDGGLSTSSRPAARQMATASTLDQRLPEVSGAKVAARTGKNVVVTGQYRGQTGASAANVSVTTPAGKTTTNTVSIGLNNYYSVTLDRVARGTTTVRFSASGARTRTIRVTGYPAAAPSVRALSSHAGSARGGTTLTITGRNFRDVTAVDFGAKRGNHVRVTSATRLTVRTPAGVGAPYVTVVTKRGGPSALTGKAVFNFLPRPAVTQVSPASGPTKGGKTVTMYGSGFAFVKGVYFGGRKASRLRVLSARELRLTVPAGHGKVEVTVVTAGGTSALTRSSRFTY
jgi:IPT/TIG domain